MGEDGKKSSAKPTVPKKTVVWWDMDTCTVPVGLDPGCVRPMIESALKKSPGFAFGLQEVTIFAHGNLLHFPPLQNKAISSSGIFMRHAHFGLKDFINELWKWIINNPPPATIMLITEDPDAEWSFHSMLPSGEYTVLPAFPGNCYGWENILKETPDLKTPSQMLVDSSQPRWFCRVCKFGCDTYPDFALHLYGYAHEDRLAGCACVPLDEFEIYQEYLDDLEEVSLADLLQVIELDAVAVSGPSEEDASKPMLMAKTIVKVKQVKQSDQGKQSDEVGKQKLKAKNIVVSGPSEKKCFPEAPQANAEEEDHSGFRT